MAAILCSKHNRQLCMITTERIANSINRKGDIEDTLYALRLNLLVGVNYHWVDRKFLQENNIKIEDNTFQVEITDEEKAFEIYCKLVPVCNECYNEFLISRNLCKPKETTGNLW